MKRLLSAAISLVASMSCTWCALAVDVVHETQLISPGTSPGISGYSLGSIAFDGTTLLVSAWNQSRSQDEMVRVFRLDADRKLVEQPAIPGTYWEQDGFASAMSISGNYALIGVPGFDLGYTDIGAAYLYELQSDGWKRLSTVTMGSSTYDHAGQAVDIAGQAMIVGTPGKSDNQYGYNGRGLTYVYTATDWNGNWNVTRLQPNGPRFWNFGGAVAIDGTAVVVGASGDGYELPRAFIFERNAQEQWPQTALLSGDTNYGRFGAAVDIKGDLAVVGAPEEYIAGQSWGAAYVFRRQGPSDWLREAKLTLPLADSWEHFGSSVSIGDDGSILIGATGYDNYWPESGAAALFTRNDQDVWSQALMLLPTVPDWGSYFGHTLAWNNGMAIIAADTEFSYLGPTGAAYAYDLTIPEPTPFVLSLIGVTICFTRPTSRKLMRNDT